MRSFACVINAVATIGFFALTTFSAPAPWNHQNYGTAPSPVIAAPAAPASTAAAVDPATTTAASSSNSGTGGTATSSGSDSSSGGSGTAGQASIVNKCTFATYLFVAKQHPASSGPTVTLAASTGTYSEAYAPASDGGHSLKISAQKGSGNILQFEYTNEGNGLVSYDLSEVNGNPFGSYGFSLTNTTADSYCAPPATSCPAIFTDPTNGVPYTATTSDGIGAILCG